MYKMSLVHFCIEPRQTFQHLGPLYHKGNYTKPLTKTKYNNLHTLLIYIEIITSFDIFSWNRCDGCCIQTTGVHSTPDTWSHLGIFVYYGVLRNLHADPLSFIPIKNVEFNP